jgi:outer membrane lipoprotein-sorting protein
VVAAGLAFVCIGCAAARPAAPPSASDDAVPTPGALETHLRNLDAALASFQGQGRLEYHGPDGKLRSASMVVVKAPDKVRIDFRTPYSITYTVVTDGSELVAYDRGEKVLYRGSPTSQNFGRYTRVPVDLAMLAALVRGLPPMPPRAGTGEIGRVPEGWRWESPLSGGGRLAIVFSAHDWRPLSAVLSGTPDGDFTAYFEDYEEVGGTPAAHRIRAELANGGRVDLSYGTVWRDRIHSDAAFRLEPPAGVRVVEMDAT